jgi:pimeloyl-ACP methyl ester carboxylesterase
MPFAHLDEVEIYYESHGEGPPLVLINGYSGNLDDWDYMVPKVEPLSKQHEVIILDNRGTGRSSKPKGSYTIHTMADDVVRLLEHLEIEKAHVLGFSMGGMIAQELAIRRQEKVDVLILVSTTPGGKAYDIRKQREEFKKLSWMYSPPSGMSEKELTDELFRIAYHAKYFEANRDRLMAPSSSYLTVEDTLEKQFDACINHDTIDKLNSINKRTLIIHGEEDLTLFPEGGRILAKNIHNSSLLMLKEAGHCVLEEKWDEILLVLLSFLSKGVHDH